ncbi:MAG: phosphomannomutase/phosphoglucomutase [candidate division Zixibacteria bacterium]|nr:phosphomannomutase/phosphoglucomutase [candidate division Zixibacteria bacterium]
MTKIDQNIFKAYDIRGTYPDQLNEDIAYKVGRVLVEYLSPKNVAVGRDMRLSSPELHEGLTRGITDGGCDVIDIGLVSTDCVYFAVGKFGYDAGVMITASHNPSEYNGFKMCRKEAVPLSGEAGIDQIKELILKDDFPTPKKLGTIEKHDVESAYIQHLFSFVDKDKIKPFKIVIDAGNGMAGKIIPRLFSHLRCKVIPMFFELDGSFPHHLANPIEPENIAPLRERILVEEADLGAAFDGDADRMFLVDEQAEPLGGDMVTALVAKNLLKKEKKATILYNLICSRVVPQIIESSGGKAVRTRVGHALIKPLMKKHNAIFGGEHSGHFYFRNNWFADSGLIALLVCLELISEENKPLSALVKSIDPYFRSGEINTGVSDIPKKLKEIERHYSSGKIDYLDGITVDFKDWWFNVRPSNTEPLLRLNIEADTKKKLEEKKQELLRLIRGV